MKTNNGKRLMAAIAVLALIACAFVAFVPSADAADSTVVSSIDLDGTYTDQFEPNEEFTISNDIIGNQLMVKQTSVSEKDVTYTITGGVSYIGINTEIEAAIEAETATEAQKAFYESKTSDTTYDKPYGIVFFAICGDEAAKKAVYPAPTSGEYFAEEIENGTIPFLKYIGTNDLTGTLTFYFVSEYEGNSEPSNYIQKVTINYTLNEMTTVDDPADLAAALKESDYVQLTSGTINTENVPAIAAGKTLVIGTDVEIDADTMFTVATGGAIQFADANSVSFNATGGGDDKVTVSIAKASGNFTVTGGSVEISGDIEGMEISGNGTENATLTDATISGTVTISCVS